MNWNLYLTKTTNCSLTILLYFEYNSVDRPMSSHSVEVTMYNYIHDKCVLRGDLHKAMQRLE